MGSPNALLTYDFLFTVFAPSYRSVITVIDSKMTFNIGFFISDRQSVHCSSYAPFYSCTCLTEHGCNG